MGVHYRMGRIRMLHSGNWFMKYLHCDGVRDLYYGSIEMALLLG
jgi:hypothetical protein